MNPNMPDDPKPVEKEEVRKLAAVIAAGILSNPQSGDFSMEISPNEIANIANLSVRVAEAICVRLG